MIGAALCGISAMIMMALFAWLFMTWTARAHEALPTAAMPNGWRYEVSCCSNFDCREVPGSAITEGPNGYVINRTGEVIPMTDPKVKASPDGEFHWCSVGGQNDSRTICLYVPPRGF